MSHKLSLEEINTRKPKSSLLTAIKDTGRHYQHRKYRRLIECRCVCGKLFYSESSRIVSGAVKSCGCSKLESVKLAHNANRNKPSHRRIKYTEGQKIGEFIFIREVPIKVYKEGRRRIAFFKCFCGNEFKAHIYAVKNLKRKSCGCLKKPNRAYIKVKRNSSLRKHDIYNSWSGMKQRCYNPKHTYYHNYGGRGIRICDRWLNSFENFLTDMGNKPTPKHSIDRFPDNDGNYEPNNCRWATRLEQAHNKVRKK